MSKKFTTVLSLVGLAIMLSYQNCGVHNVPTGDAATANNGQSISVTGTIQKATLDKPLVDGCKVLVCSFDNKLQKPVCFIPVRFDSTQFKDGDTVTLNGVIRKDIVTTCMAGDVLQVQKADFVSSPGATPSPSPNL